MTKRVIDRRKIDMLHRAVSLRQHGLLFILSSREILYSDTVGTVFVSPKFYYVLRCTVHLFSAQQYADRAICYRPSVCPSVRLSVTSRYCVKTKKASVIISSPSGSPTILVFWRKFHPDILRGPPEQGRKTRERVGKISSFISLTVNISKTVADTAKVTIND